MARYSRDRRSSERRRSSGYGTYRGLERRNGRDRRRSYDRHRSPGRKRSSENGENEETYYYAPKKATQNPMTFVGIAAGVVVLIIIIAVAASGPSRSGKDSQRQRNYRSVQEMEARADESYMLGGGQFQTGKEVERESGKAAANSYYQQAYDYFVQAHDVYADLDSRYPNSRFQGKLHDVEKVMQEILKEIGTGN